MVIKNKEKTKEEIEMIQSKKLSKARKEIKEGKVISLEDVAKKLNL